MIEENMNMATLKIEGMKCMHCVGNVKKTLESIEGLSGVEVDLENNEARFEGTADIDLIKKAIADKGFQVVE